MTKYRFLSTIAAFGVFGYATSAFGLDATTRTRARDLVNSGVQDFERGEFEVARRQFAEALTLAEVPTVAVWAARAHEKVGRLLEAASLYRRALTLRRNELWSGQLQQQAQKAATEALGPLEKRIPRVVIELMGENSATVEVLLDGTKVSVGGPELGHPSDPGLHRVEARRGEQIVAGRSVTLMEGETQTVQLTLPSAEPLLLPTQSLVTLHPVRLEPAPGGRNADTALARKLAWVSLGIGAAGVAVGTVAGITTGAKHADLQSSGCGETTCQGSKFSDPVDGYNTWRTVSTVGFIVGAVGAAAGVTLWLTTPKKETPSRVGFQINPRNVAIAGEF